jgi:streptogramin lyase
VRRLPLLAVVAVTLLSTASSGASPRLPVQAVIVPTGRGPCGVATRAGSLWVGVYGTGKVLQIDPRGRIETTIGVGRWACRVAVGPAAVWVTRDRAGELVRISRGSGRRFRVKVGTGTFDVLLAAGSVWASSYDFEIVARLDSRTGQLIAASRDGPNPAGLAWCGGRVWVGHGRHATWLTAIDPRNMRVERVEVGVETPSTPQCVLGDLWVTTADSVLRLDAHSGAVLRRVHLGGTPADVAAGPDGLVWVTDKERSQVFRVDPMARGILDSFAAGPGAFALARLGSSVWVTSFAGDDVRRFDP